MSFRFFRPWEDGGQGNIRQTADGHRKASSEPSKAPTPPFRFFRPWEDSGQGNTRQTADGRQKASLEPSKAPTPPHVLSVHAEERVVPSQEATRSVQALSDIPGPLYQEEETHRTEKEDVWNASTLHAPSMENSLVSLDRVLRQTSSCGSSKNAGSASIYKDSACTNNESENYARHNINHSWKSSCQRDKHSSEAHKTRSSIATSHITSTVASQNDPSLQVASADASLIPSDNLYTLNPLAGSASCVAENALQSKTTPDMSADDADSRLEMNNSKFIADSSKLHKQDLHSPATARTEVGCVDTLSDARQEHRQMRSKPFQSKICRKSFAQSGNMHLHKKTHSEPRPFQCSVCDNTFSRLGHLRTHIAIHAKSKPHQCTLCDKAFSYPSNLHVHRRIHTGSKPFKCSVCEKAFTQSGNLLAHERIHAGSKPFKCSVCEKAFTRSDGLHNHECIHTGSKPFKCSVCEKAFTQYGNLLAHERNHTGSKPFKCLVCEKAFTLSSNLKVHKRIHTGSKPFKCSFCKRAFAHSSMLHRHERLHRIQTIST